MAHREHKLTTIAHSSSGSKDSHFHQNPMAATVHNTALGTSPPLKRQPAGLQARRTTDKKAPYSPAIPPEFSKLGYPASESHRGIPRAYNTVRLPMNKSRIQSSDSSDTNGRTSAPPPSEVLRARTDAHPGKSQSVRAVEGYMPGGRSTRPSAFHAFIPPPSSTILVNPNAESVRTAISLIRPVMQ